MNVIHSTILVLFFFFWACCHKKRVPTGVCVLFSFRTAWWVILRPTTGPNHWGWFYREPTVLVLLYVNLSAFRRVGLHIFHQLFHLRPWVSVRPIIEPGPFKPLVLNQLRIQSVTRLSLQNCIFHIRNIISTTKSIMCKLFDYRYVEPHQKKTRGASRVAAKLNAAWASPSLAVPSPK